jgi:Fungal protein kinase
MKYTLFRDIEGTSEKYPRSHHRQLISTQSSKIPINGSSMPQVDPDFLLADVPNAPDPTSLTTAVQARHIKPRQVTGFVEVKASEAERPFTSRNVVKDLTAQVSDYARLVFSVRPFQIFVVGMMIYGWKFSLAFFDRGGVLMSREYHIEEDLDVFVAVVRRLVCDVSPTDLGRDPSVQLFENDTYHQDTYPRFRVGMGGLDNRYWITEGPPMWTSLSLLGRGTSVWHATGQDGKLILKIAWRDASRMSETDIYAAVRVTHAGIADCLGGGDVSFPSLTAAVPVNVQQLHRRVFHSNSSVTRNLVLHRVTIRPVGRPLWEFESADDLIKGLRAIVTGELNFSTQDDTNM